MIAENPTFDQLIDAMNKKHKLALLQEKNQIQPTQKVSSGISVLSNSSNIRLRTTDVKFEFGTNGEPKLVHSRSIEIKALSEKSPNVSPKRQQSGSSDSPIHEIVIVISIFLLMLYGLWHLSFVLVSWPIVMFILLVALIVMAIVLASK